MSDDPIQTVPNTTPDEPIPVVDPSKTENPKPSAETATDRAGKAAYGLKGKVPATFDDFYNQIISGSEPQMRQQVAAKLDEFKRNRQQGALDEMVKSLGRPLTIDEFDELNKSLDHPEDPRSVIEDHYAARYMGHLNWKNADPDNDAWTFQAQTFIPRDYRMIQQTGEDVIRTREFINTLKQDAGDAMNQQSTFGYGVDFAKQFIPLYQDYELRNFGGAGTFTDSMLGANMEANAMAILSLPWEQRKDKIQNVFNDLKKRNPQEAMRFLDVMEGQSRSERYVNNLFSAWDAISIAGPTLKLTGAIANRFTLLGTTSSAVRRMVREVESGARTAAEAAAAASGDMAGAAAAHTRSDIVDMVGGKADPRQQAIAYLHNFFKGKIDDLYTNVGTGNAMELVRQMRERYMTMADSLIDRLSASVRVQHVPEEVLNALITHYRSNIDRYFPGIGNSILDFSVPIRNESENSWSFNIHFGNSRREYFDSSRAAIAYADLNGISKNRAIETVPETFSQAELRDIMNRYINERDQHLLRAGIETLSKGTRSEARSAAAALDKKINALNDRIKNFGVEGHGAGYYIRVNKPLDLTQPFIRNAITEASKVAGGELRTPDSYLNAILRRVRTPDETLSEFQRRNRGLSVHGPNALMQLAHELGTEIQQLAKGTYPFTTKRQKWKDFEHVLSEQQKIPDPVDGVPGYTFRNVAEFQLAYMRYIGRLPDADEVKAYWSQKMLYEMDHVLRTISLRRNKSVVGAETHTISAFDRDNKRVLSKAFDGIVRTSLPNDGGNVMVVTRNLGSWWGSDRARQVNALGRSRAAIDKAVKEGKARVVQIYDEYATPLNNFGETGGHSIRYVVVPTNQLRTDALTWNQLPERGGGHFIYNYPHFIKQAQIDHEVVSRDPTTGKPTRIRHVYKGDTTVMGIPVRAMGKDVVDKINQFRVLLRDRKIDEAKQFLLDNPIGIDYGELSKWFKQLPRRLPSGKMQAVKPWLDINEPLTLVERNSSVGDLSNELKNRYNSARRGGSAPDGHEFFNGTKSGSLASQRQVAFTGERDSRSLMAMNDIGGAGNPIYKYAPAQLISPINALNRGISGIANSFYMDEYRWTAMEHWLREAQPYLNLRKNEVETSPYSVFNNPNYIKGDREAQVRIQQLETTRYQINSLTGMASNTDGVTHALAQRMADFVYKHGGPRFIIDPVWTAAILRDPTRFIRSMAFHVQLGFFNLPQYVRQMGTFASIFGVAGSKYAGSGTLAAFIHGWTNVNATEEIIKGLDAHLSQYYVPGMSNWKPGEFKEAFEFGRDSGFLNVAGEYAARDDVYSSNVVQKGWGRFLDAGTVFFTAGEKMVRRGALYTAYREFRDANPTGPFTQADKLKVLTRARDLNVNMDRAANSILQKGIGSIPLQFLTYQMRNMELFWGKRLTKTEKLRFLGVNAVLYGIPGGAAITGFPFGDFVKETALNQGYDVGNNYITDTLMQGVPASILAIATGNWYNINEAIGPQGWEPIREAMRGDTTVWGLALGAMGSTLETAWRQSDGIKAMALSYFSDDDQVIPFVKEDVLDVFNTLSSVYHISQTGMALYTHQWVSRRGERLDTDINPLNAIFMYLMGGLSPERASNVNIVTQALADRKEDQKKVENFFIKEFRRGIDLAQNGEGYNPDEAQKHFTRAFHSLNIVGYPREDLDKLLARAEDGYQTLIERVAQEYWTKNVYNQQKIDAAQSYSKFLKNYKYGDQ